MTKVNRIGGGEQAPEPKKPALARNSDMKESLFLKLDKNNDKRISRDELSAAGYSGNSLNTLSQMIFFAERDVNKWFTSDKDFNGVRNNIESKMWETHNVDEGHKDGDLSQRQLAIKHGIGFVYDTDENFESWCKTWIEDDNPMIGLKAQAKEFYGMELSDDEVQLLYDAMKNHANRWLLKDPALYNRLNVSAYTRLATSEQTESCCGGDISKPPIGKQPELNPDGTLKEDKKNCALIFSPLEVPEDVNTSEELKNRLAWAAFKTIPESEVAKMSPSEYSFYQRQWNQVRNLTAADYHRMLYNDSERETFEANSNMTVQQIVDYIGIVEQSIGKDFDSDDWSVTGEIFHGEIMAKLNGTYGDDSILKGKTRADIPADRQDWLKYLEEHDLLLDQFKSVWGEPDDFDWGDL